MYSPSNPAGIIGRHWIAKSIFNAIYHTARGDFTGDIVTTFPWNTLYPHYGAMRTHSNRANNAHWLQITQDIVLMISMYATSY